MEALEQELVEKLNNVFSFSFKVKFQDLKADDIFEVYRIVILTYDNSWIVKDLKQVQGFLQRMELGHLLNKGDITKREDLLDTKKNCRLLGAVLAKLESKFKSKQALAAAVRKLRLLKSSKTEHTSNNKKQPTPSASSNADTELKEELDPFLVPNKGNEIPRTPLRNNSSEKEKQNIMEKKLGDSVIDYPLKQILKHQVHVTKPGIIPTRPTKEIPRTPIGGATCADSTIGHQRNPNLTQDFSNFFSRPKLASTSTPYHPASSPTNQDDSSPHPDATFVVFHIPRSVQSTANEDQVFDECKGSDSASYEKLAITLEKAAPFATFGKGSEEEKEEKVHDGWNLEMSRESDTNEDELPVEPEIVKPLKSPKENSKMDNRKPIAKAASKEKKITAQKPLSVKVKENIDADSVASNVKKARGLKTIVALVEEKSVNVEPKTDGDPHSEIKEKRVRGRKPKASDKESHLPEMAVAEPTAKSEDRDVNRKESDYQNSTKESKKSCTVAPVTAQPIAHCDYPKIKKTKGRGKQGKVGEAIQREKEAETVEEGDHDLAKKLCRQITESETYPIQESTEKKKKVRRAIKETREEEPVTADSIEKSDEDLGDNNNSSEPISKANREPEPEDVTSAVQVKRRKGRPAKCDNPSIQNDDEIVAEKIDQTAIPSKANKIKPSIVPEKKMNEAAEVERPRKSSRHHGEPAKSYQELELTPIVKRKRKGRKKDETSEVKASQEKSGKTISNADDVEVDKKKNDENKKKVGAKKHEAKKKDDIPPKESARSPTKPQKKEFFEENSTNKEVESAVKNKRDRKKKEPAPVVNQGDIRKKVIQTAVPEVEKEFDEAPQPKQQTKRVVAPIKCSVNDNAFDEPTAGPSQPTRSRKLKRFQPPSDSEDSEEVVVPAPKGRKKTAK